jgi:O-methyltransferase
MNGSTGRVLRRGVDRVLKPVGGRVVTRAEEAAIAGRHRSLVVQLHAAYASWFSPALADRPGRVELLCQLRGTETTEALFLLHWLQQALDGPGEVCELGVAQGATSALLANEIRDTDRMLWLYDSFQGLSAPQEKDRLLDDLFGLGSMDRYEATMAFPKDAVLERLRAVAFPSRRTRVVEGFIRADLPAESLPETVAFGYLDFDLYEPVGVGLELLHPRCRPGSILMVDDYGYFSSGPQTAVAEFLAVHRDRYELMEPPPGAGHFCALRRTGP